MRLLRLIAAVSLLPLTAFADERIPLQTTEVLPVRREVRGDTLFLDFGKAAFGTVKLEFASNPKAEDWVVRLGEKLADDGSIDRKPPGSVAYREISFTTQPGERFHRLFIPSTERHKNDRAAVRTPLEIGEVTPFRYVEIEGGDVSKTQAIQLFVHVPFDDEAASFESSNETLNAVWELCKHTMKATSAFGVYIDGERERIPYEADAYINQLSHYACDLDPRLARYTIGYLLEHPTWPTEWSHHMPMMAAADYVATGDPVVAAEHFDALERKLLMEKAREDGLLRAWAIVDWPAAERDGYDDGKISPKDQRQVGPEVNTVVNAFYYHALRQMSLLARALGKDSGVFDARAKQVYDSFNRVFFDTGRGIYIDGEGSTHASLHANMFPLAFGLVPEDRRDKVADFVESRGMACSVYGAQYLLEALFDAGRDDYAIRLMSARTERSWWHMIEMGSTMTTEAWDVKFKKNLTWNHAWGAAPANILTRYVLGVRPAEPGYKRILVAPQIGDLQWVKGKVPTAVGPVTLEVKNGAEFRIQFDVPVEADVRLPRRETGKVILDGVEVPAKSDGKALVISGVKPGRHVAVSR